MLKNLFKSSDVIVQQIHDEIDQAQDNLLAEAKKIIYEKEKEFGENVEEKSKRLALLGFMKSEVVRQADGLVKTKQDAELIGYYKQNYPFQKFITESEMNRICEKYNLIYAPVGNYIKDVPEKNIKEIENALLLKSEDIPIDPMYVKEFSFLYTDKEKIEWFEANVGYETDISTDQRFSGRVGGRGTTFMTFSTPMLGLDIRSITQVDRQGLFIAAPESHFDLSLFRKTGKFAFMNFTVIAPVKDPIVFRYCRGGIQIISKWGLEAKDELVVNPIEN